MNEPLHEADVVDGAMAVEFNRIMSEVGRKDRVLRLAESRGDCGTFFGSYLVADPAKVLPLFASLGIPLRDL